MTDYAPSCGAATSTVCSSPATFSIHENQLKCPMCRQYFVKPVRLCCGHSFCKVCVDKWLRNCTTCSVCRAPTLNPVRDHHLEQLVLEAQESKNMDRPMFSRAINDQFRQHFRNGRIVREVKALQKESTRASMRRPQNLKFKVISSKPTESNANKENLIQEGRGSIIYRSIRRIKKIF